MDLDYTDLMISAAVVYICTLTDNEDKKAKCLPDRLMCWLQIEL